jgi:hypothetical protein
MSVRTRTIVQMAAVAIVFGGTCAGIGAAIASQPQMEGALSALQAAQDNLRRVTLNKDGHAEKARRLVAEAINEVESGIAYGRAHGL